MAATGGMISHFAWAHINWGLKAGPRAVQRGVQSRMEGALTKLFPRVLGKFFKDSEASKRAGITSANKISQIIVEKMLVKVAADLAYQNAMKNNDQEKWDTSL